MVLAAGCASVPMAVKPDAAFWAMGDRPAPGTPAAKAAWERVRLRPGQSDGQVWKDGRLYEADDDTLSRYFGQYGDAQALALLPPPQGSGPPSPWISSGRIFAQLAMVGGEGAVAVAGICMTCDPASQGSIALGGALVFAAGLPAYFWLTHREGVDRRDSRRQAIERFNRDLSEGLLVTPSEP